MLYHSGFWMRVDLKYCRVAAWLSAVVGAQVEGKESELAVCRSRLQQLTRELRSSGAENSLLRSGVALVDSLIASSSGHFLFRRIRGSLILNRIVLFSLFSCI